MPPNPWQDFIAFVSTPNVVTVIFWVLLAASLVIAVIAFSSNPSQRTVRNVGIWLLRLIMGGMWWQQSLWKIPPNYDGLIYWMQQITEHSSIPLQGQLVRDIVLPNIGIFAPLVYLCEVCIGISLMLGLLTRISATLGALLTLNLWLGLYSAPGEWPWTYGFLLIIQLLFVIDPPGRSLGADILLRRNRRLPALFG